MAHRTASLSGNSLSKAPFFPAQPFRMAGSISGPMMGLFTVSRSTANNRKERGQLQFQRPLRIGHLQFDNLAQDMSDKDVTLLHARRFIRGHTDATVDAILQLAPGAPAETYGHHAPLSRGLHG